MYPNPTLHHCFNEHDDINNARSELTPDNKSDFCKHNVINPSTYPFSIDSWDSNSTHSFSDDFCLRPNENQFLTTAQIHHTRPNFAT